MFNYDNESDVEKHVKMNHSILWKEILFLNFIYRMINWEKNRSEKSLYAFQVVFAGKYNDTIYI